MLSAMFVCWISVCFRKKVDGMNLHSKVELAGKPFRVPRNKKLHSCQVDLIGIGGEIMDILHDPNTSGISLFLSANATDSMQYEQDLCMFCVGQMKRWKHCVDIACTPFECKQYEMISCSQHNLVAMVSICNTYHNPAEIKSLPTNV